jgi:hypothetical protein
MIYHKAIDLMIMTKPEMLETWEKHKTNVKYL